MIQMEQTITHLVVKESITLKQYNIKVYRFLQAK